MLERSFGLSKENIPSDIFIYGIAVSNLANEYNFHYTMPEKLPELFSYLEKEGMGIEMQFEPIDVYDFRRVPIHHLPFLGVHYPTMKENNGHPQSVKEVMDTAEKTLLISRQLNADYLVVHLDVEYDWDNLSDRKKAIDRGLTIFNDILEKADHVGFQGDILIENLEFPLYPALSDEVLDVYKMIEKSGNRQLGIALDLGHLLHTANLLNINRHKGEPIAPFLEDPFVKGEINFNTYLNDLIKNIKPRLKLVHIAGAHDHETHLLPTLNYCGDDRTQLDLIADLGIIGSSVAETHIPVINEAHGKPYQDMVNACKIIQSQI